MAKTPFVLNDESINSYGFRVLTSGIQVDRFRQNPVMLYSHIRGFERVSGDPLLPLGRWENLHQDGSKLVAESDFDMEDDFAVKVSKKVDKGVLNACSIGIDIIEISEDPSLMLPGQTMPTITKCVLKEVSICDIPANSNALRLNYQGSTINLDSSQHSAAELEKLFSPKKNETSMKSIIAVLNGLNTGVSLSDDSKETEVLTALQKAINTNQNAAAEKDRNIAELTGEVKTLKDAGAAAAEKTANDMAVALVDGAVAANKILAGAKDQFVKLAKADYASTKLVLDGLQPYKSVSAQINKNKSSAELSDAETKAKKYDELDKIGKLLTLRNSNKDEFKELYLAKWGKEYKS
jgi:phage head maturation protease